MTGASLVRYVGPRRSLLGVVGLLRDDDATLCGYSVDPAHVEPATVQLWRNGAHVRDVADWQDGCSAIARETGGRMIAALDPSPLGLSYATDDDLWELRVT